jgi:hypothetical protein
MLSTVLIVLMSISALSSIITCYSFFTNNGNWQKIAIALISFVLLLIIYFCDNSGKKSHIEVSQKADSVLSKPVSLPLKPKDYYTNGGDQQDTQTVHKKVAASPRSSGTNMNASSNNTITVSNGSVINNQGGIINQQNTGSQK